MIYGLVAPGYEMAEIVAGNLTGGDERFQGTDLSTKLKLMGVDVASFGEYEAAPERATPLTWEDPFAGVYKKLLFSHDGHALAGRRARRRRRRLRHARGTGQKRGSAAVQTARIDRAASRRVRQDSVELRACRTRRRSVPATMSPREPSARPFASQELTSLGQVKTCHEGRHRLRWLPAARHRPLQGRP